MVSVLQLITYEALGLCGPGEAGKLIDKGEVTYGGKWVVNPSGGLISKGHPLGATGLAQCAELCWQVHPSYHSFLFTMITIKSKHNPH
jgi:acetyl-CoA acetyltransferase